VEIPIKDLPFFSTDRGADFPQAARDFRAQIDALGGVIIGTPEYNGAIPGVREHASERAGRPDGHLAFGGPPAAGSGASPGGIATPAAQQHLTAALSHVTALVMGPPEGFIQVTPGLIDENHDVTNEGTREFLVSYLDAFL